jgi:hypothetical protein
MGAELWYHEAPWHPDPAEELRELQSRFVVENYNLSALLPKHLAWAREAVADAKATDDPHQLEDLYWEQVRLLEHLSSQPIPEDPQSQIEILHQIHAGSGQGLSNVLDLIGVSRQRDFFVAHALDDAEVVRFVGAARPKILQAREAVEKINEELDRGECVCVQVYDDVGNKPVCWFFVGNTVD